MSEVKLVTNNLLNVAIFIDCKETLYAKLRNISEKLN